jgi:hypothetical protein
LEWALSGALQRIRDEDVVFLKRFLWTWNSIEWRGRCIEEMQAIGRVLSIGPDTAIRFLKFAILRALIPADLARPVHLQIPFPRGQVRSPMSVPAWSHLRQVRGLA